MSCVCRFLGLWKRVDLDSVISYYYDGNHSETSVALTVDFQILWDDSQPRRRFDISELFGSHLASLDTDWFPTPISYWINHLLVLVTYCVINPTYTQSLYFALSTWFHKIYSQFALHLFLIDVVAYILYSGWSSPPPHALLMFSSPFVPLRFSSVHIATPSTPSHSSHCTPGHHTIPPLVWSYTPKSMSATQGLQAI